MANNPDPAQEIKRLENELQARQMSIRQLESLLESQNWMKEHAESARDAIRAKLEFIAESLCSQMVNDLHKQSPDGISLIGHEELADSIIENVRKQMNSLEVSANSQGMSDADVESENLRLQREIIRLEESLEREEEAHEKTRQDLEQVQSTLNAALATARNKLEPEPATRSDTENMPEWLSELQQWPQFDRGMKLLRIVAETGMSRRSDVANAYGDVLEADPRSNSVRRMFPYLQERGLLDLITVDSETSGASTQDLVRLSDRGKQTCRLVLRLDPVPDEVERLLPRCETMPRVLLVLEAAEILRDAGFTVDVAPNPVDVRLTLDIQATFENETVFVMVEGKDSDAGEWNHRWQDHYDVIGGSFYVIVASKKIQSRVLSSVNLWAQKNKRRLKLHVTNIGAVRGKGRRGHDIWTIRRNLGG